MSSLEEWKDKIWSYGNLHKKQVIAAIGVAAFMGTSFLFFRHLHLKRSPTVQHIHTIYENIQKGFEKGEQCIEQLIIQEQYTRQFDQLTMIYTLVSKLKQKQRNNEESMRNPFLPPFENGIFIQDLGPSHRLLFNKFSLYPQHLLITSKQFEPQSAPLNKDDFKQCIYTFKAIKGLYFFNSGPKAGASQIHKHIQIFPNEARDLPIFRNILQFSREKKHHSEFKNLNPEDIGIIEYPAFNFKHGLVLIGLNDMHSESENDRRKEENNTRIDRKMSILKELTFKAYQRLCSEFLSNNEGVYPDYNLIGCQDFLMMIPRRKQKAFNDISVNAVGFMGSILFNDRNLLKKYNNQERKDHQILEDITFPKSKKY